MLIADTSPPGLWVRKFGRAAQSRRQRPFACELHERICSFGQDFSRPGHARTYIVAERRPMLAPSRPTGTVAPFYQCSPSFEPSAAAVIIAGIPIPTVASAIARASIMTIPLDSASSSTSIGSLRNRFADQHLPHACFRRISPQSFWFRGGENLASVSQFVAGIRHGRSMCPSWPTCGHRGG